MKLLPGKNGKRHFRGPKNRQAPKAPKGAEFDGCWSALVPEYLARAQVRFCQ